MTYSQTLIKKGKKEIHRDGTHSGGEAVGLKNDGSNSQGVPEMRRDGTSLY